MKMLFNPFERFRESQLLVFGAIVTLIGSLLGWVLKGRFDGILDMHFVENVIWYQPLLDNVINIASGTLFFFLAGIAINRKTRVIDILVGVLVARSPLYILPLFNIGNYISDATTEILKSVSGDPQKLMENVNVGLLAVFGIVSILFIVWFITLLYNGFRVAANGKGPGSVILFIIALILSEVASKWLIVLIS